MFKKNDIKSLPFQQIPGAISATIETLGSERLESLKKIARLANVRKLNSLMKESSSYGESNEGLEESVAESLGLDKVDGIELSQEATREIREAAVAEVCSKFIEAYDLANKFTWVLPQMKAHFGAWKAVVGEDGLYSGRETVKVNCKDDDFNKGLWFIAQRPRSGLISGQGVKLYVQGEVNNLVPLILSGFKTFQNIPYSKWSRVGLSSIVDADLCEAMLANSPALNTEEVLALREHGLRVLTGAKQGSLRSPQTTAMLYNLKVYPITEISTLPKLAVVMLAQIWCAHPANRTDSMVLDPHNWDSMPEPILSGEILKPVTPAKTKKVSKADEPWWI